ncbi:MAG TPA: hypothetical protein VFZ17_05155, partial [Acidimicrobiia bacterium]|nr:hypothetical protein [Acidimicrobiia bacterium]
MAGPMSGVAMVARSELRRRWRSLVVLTVLVAVSAAVTLALVAGARRTSSALVRFETYSQSADVELTVGEATDAQLRAFARSPGVKAFAPVRQVTLVVKDSRRFLPTAAQSSDAFGTTVDRPV